MSDLQAAISELRALKIRCELAEDKNRLLEGLFSTANANMNARGRVEAERDRYRAALQKICNPDKCKWLASEMFHIAKAALDGRET